MPYTGKFREVVAESWKFWLVFSLALILGIFLSIREWGDPHHLVPRILPKLGEALMIASILALVIDGVSKRKLLDEFLRDISIHILGRRLPRELRDRMIDYLDIYFVRSNWVVTYTITEIPGHPGFIKLVTRSEYDIENRSSFVKPYAFCYDVEECWFPGVGETSITWAKAGDFFQHKEGDADFIVTSSEGFKKFSETIRLAPFDERKPRACRCEVESTEYFKNGGTTPFIAYYPVLNTTITIYYPKNALSVDIKFSSAEIEEDMDKKPKQHCDHWIISKPILPGQGFFTRWEPLATPIPSTGSLPPANAQQLQAQRKQEPATDNPDVFYPDDY